jgi:hypothetical protein
LFSPCGRYRWWLLRSWQPARSAVVFVGLNPSTADGTRNDATLERLLRLARHWGHGGLLVLNLFARTGRHPDVLRRCADPVGARNDAWLVTALDWLGQPPTAPEGPPPRVWLGWGQRGGLHARDRRVLDLLRCWKGELVSVGTTRGGHPRHPLYTRSDQDPLPFHLPFHVAPLS